MKTITIFIFSITLLASIVSSQNLCNGYAELCDKKFSDIAFPTTHNSYASEKSIASNQNYDIPTQLKDGIRGFMLDAHYGNNTNEVRLCHSSCDLLDHGLAKDTLAQIVTWLDANPNEVITILWENFDKVPAATYNDFYTQSGLVKYAYFQEVGQDWPTLSQLIQGGKRAVNFVDNLVNPDPSAQWLMAEYNYVFETPFDNENMNSFQCTIDRPKGQERPMYVLNHFLYGSFQQVDIPQPAKAGLVNSASLSDHAQQCQKTFNKIPNYVAVDFYDKGDGQNVFSTVANLNGVKYVAKPLGDGSNPNGIGSPNNSKPSAAQPITSNIITNLASIGTLAMFIL